MHAPCPCGLGRMAAMAPAASVKRLAYLAAGIKQRPSPSSPLPPACHFINPPGLSLPPSLQSACGLSLPHSLHNTSSLSPLPSPLSPLPSPHTPLLPPLLQSACRHSSRRTMRSCACSPRSGRPSCRTRQCGPEMWVIGVQPLSWARKLTKSSRSSRQSGRSTMLFVLASLPLSVSLLIQPANLCFGAPTIAAHQCPHALFIHLARSSYRLTPWTAAGTPRTGGRVASRWHISFSRTMRLRRRS